ncbi:MAG: ATP-binding protein [Thiothrix sp.]
MLLLVSLSPASASVLYPEQQSAEIIDLPPYLHVLEDPAQQLSITEISAPGQAQLFAVNTREALNFGYTRSNWWLRFDVNIQSGKTWYLEVDQPVGGDIELFILPKNKDISRDNAAPPLFKRLEDYRTPAWRLNLPPGETFSVYLQANNGQAILRLPLRLMTADAFITHGNRQYLFFMLVFAGLSVLGVYNLSLLFSLRESSYLSLVIFIAGMQIIFFRDSNLFPASAFLSDTRTWYYPTFILLTMAAAFNYWRSLNTNGNAKLEILLKWLQRGTLIIAPVAHLTPNIVQLACLLLLSVNPVLLLFITQTALGGHRLTRSTYWAGTSAGLALSIYVLPHSGWSVLPVSSVYIGQAGFLLAILLLSINQADRSRLLREQAENERAANQAKDEFLTTMSHELRTPLNIVTGIGELLRQTPLSAQQQDYLGKQEKATRHLLHLVDELLDLSRMQGEPPEPVNAPFRLSELLAELEQLFNVQAAQKGLDLQIDANRCPQAILLGDAKRLQQVLINLLGNAVKYTDTGRVTLTVAPLDTVNGQNLSLRFEVADTGIGIPADKQPHLFKPFYQVNSSRNRQYGGSGLGLAISHKLVSCMGGELKLHSSPGTGSRFFFTQDFPLQQADMPAGRGDTQADPPPENTLRGIRILLVDDDEINRFVGKKLLASRGAEILLAEGGSQAIRQVTQKTPDVVLMDISMPGIDGYETTRRIRAADPRFRNLPIIALTAHAIDGERERCLAAGMNDLVTKPFALDTLVACIAAHTR